MKIVLKIKILIILFSVISCLAVKISAQKFEGKIVYATQFKGKSLYSRIHYDTTTMLIKRNMLKSWHTLSPNTQIYYLNGTEYYINIVEERISLDISSDITKKKLEKRNGKLRQTKYKEKINGLHCNRFDYKEKTNSGREYLNYWIADNWEVDFSWGYYIVKDEGIVLKLKIDYQKHTAVIAVLEIVPMKLDDKLFELPDYPIKEVNMDELSKAYINERE